MLKASKESAMGQGVPAGMTPGERRRAARQWVKAAIAYGANPRIVDLENGYLVTFEEPDTKTGNPDPGPYRSELKAEVRAVLGAMGRIDCRHEAIIS